MATIWRDFMFLFPIAATVFLVLLRPGIPEIVDAFLYFCLLLATAAFGIHLIGRFRKFLVSFRVSPGINNEINSSALAEALNQVRQKSQASYNEQVAVYQENVLLPREEEKRRIKEEKFFRFSRLSWASSGHALGGSKSFSESSLRQLSSPATDNTGDSASVSDDVVTTDQSSRKIFNPKTLPNEPEVNAPDSITILLKSPRGSAFKRRFLVTDKVETLLHYMASVGFHPKIYALFLSYPRQSVCNNPTLSLKELGIVHDVLLNIEEKDE